jgi:hypothetical protein
MKVYTGYSATAAVLWTKQDGQDDTTGHERGAGNSHTQAGQISPFRGGVKERQPAPIADSHFSLHNFFALRTLFSHVISSEFE